MAVLLVLIAKKGSIDDYLQPYEDFINEYQTNIKPHKSVE